MPDQLEDLFADLRASTLSQVLPPGSEAARRTVRRRRRTSRSVAVVAVSLAVAGGLGLASGGPRQQSPAERLSDLVGAARRALEKQLPDLTGGTLSGPVAADGTATFADLPAGAYRLSLTCAGTGAVTVDAKLRRDAGTPTALGGQVVSCADDPTVSVVTFRLPVGGSVVISVVGDSAAVGNAGYAAELGDGGDSQPSGGTVPGPESTWNAARAADVLKAGGRPAPDQVTTERVSSELSFTPGGTRSRPGDYELAMVCAGPGSVSVTVRIVDADGGLINESDPAAFAGRVECQDIDPRLDETNVLTLPQGSDFLITGIPDEQARDRAGWAFSFTAR